LAILLDFITSLLARSAKRAASTRALLSENF